MTVDEFIPFNRLKACRHGEMLYNLNDAYVGRSLDLYGEYSEGEIELFRQVVQPGSAVVEVGASIGAHTVFLAKHVGRRGLVMAFEPQRILFQTLCANVALNHLTNVYCMPMAVGAALGRITVPLLDATKVNNFGGMPLGSFDVGESVPVLTLDSLNLPRCDFLKVDVEGMEQQVLEGAAGLIARTRPILYVENDKPEKSDDLVRTIDRLGYAMYWHYPRYYSPDNFLANRENVFAEQVSYNMLCIDQRQPHELTGFPKVPVPA